MKKIISVLLFVLCMVCAVSAFANTSGDFEYTVLDDGTAQITQYKGKASELAVPAELDGHAVTVIGDSSFSSCSRLTSVTIPDSVTSIRDYAFSGCRKLTSVTVPDSVTSIGDYAFASCFSLTSVTIPDGVTSIGDHVFSYCCSLKSVTIPDSLTSIGTNPFSDC